MSLSRPWKGAWPSSEKQAGRAAEPCPRSLGDGGWSCRDVPGCLLSRRPPLGPPARSAVEPSLEDTFQGHSFCLEQGLGLNYEPETRTKCTGLLNLEPNPNIFYIAENQTGVWGFSPVCFPTREHFVNKAKPEQISSVSPCD